MKNRNKHFEKKYQKAEGLSDFFVYAYASSTKSSLDLILSRELSIIKLKKLNLPSAFKLEKKHKSQGPRIIMIYGCNFNFTKINYIEKCQVLGIKINNIMYSYYLIKEALFYKTPVNLCYSLNTNLFKNLVKFSLIV